MALFHRTRGGLVDARKIAASLALGAAMVAVPASSAFAAVSLTNGAYAATTIQCNRSMDWERETITIRPASGLSSQPVAFHEYIQPLGGTGFWTAWTGVTAPYSYTTVHYVSGANFTVYMEYAWYRSGAWTYAGEWIKTYAQYSGTGFTYMTYCAV
jgi:hypothetical protein